mgnify:FL=1
MKVKAKENDLPEDVECGRLLRELIVGRGYRITYVAKKAKQTDLSSILSGHIRFKKEGATRIANLLKLDPDKLIEQVKMPSPHPRKNSTKVKPAVKVCDLLDPDEIALKELLEEACLKRGLSHRDINMVVYWIGRIGSLK